MPAINCTVLSLVVYTHSKDTPHVITRVTPPRHLRSRITFVMPRHASDATDPIAAALRARQHDDLLPRCGPALAEDEHT